MLPPAGFPHSDIQGSKPACGSPWLIAACHVLPRLSAPRHPPCALTALDQFRLNDHPHDHRQNQDNPKRVTPPRPPREGRRKGPAHLDYRST